MCIRDREKAGGGKQRDRGHRAWHEHPSCGAAPVSYTHLDVYKRQPYVNVPNDLSKVKTKMALNLTKRQLICFGCAAAVGIQMCIRDSQSRDDTGLP